MADDTAAVEVEEVGASPEEILVSAARAGDLEQMKSTVGQLQKVNFRDGAGNTALHYCALCGSLEGLEFLLTLPKINLNLKNMEGDSPLHVAAREGEHEIIERLIDAGVFLEPLNRHRQKPSQLAATPEIRAMIQGAINMKKLGAGDFAADDEDSEASDDEDNV